MNNLQRREGRTVLQWMGTGVWLLNRYALPGVAVALIALAAGWAIQFVPAGGLFR